MTTKRILIAIIITVVSLMALLLNTYFNSSGGTQPASNTSNGLALTDILVFALLIGFVMLYVAYRKIAAQQEEIGSRATKLMQNGTTDTEAIDEEFATTLINQLATFDSDKKYLDSADIKQLFKISDKTLYRWRKNGIIPFTNLGGKLVYPKQAVMGILQQRLDNKYDPIHIKKYQKENP